MKKSSIIHKRIYLFPRGEDGVLTLLVCVLMTAALILSVYLCFERSDLSAPEKTGTQEELLLDPETAGLPLIRIWTDDGRPPTFSVADTPEGLMGQTITDNTYKKGICTIENVSSLPRFSSRMKLKVRGNASAIVAGADGKLQYKLVLDAPVGLFEDETAETRFILLADAGANLKTWLGFRIGELCGMDWTLKSRYVNLVLNDEYRGLYLLTEAKDGSSLREHIGDGGFLIESDAYWWNEDVYFHSKFLTETMAFTIQYPELTDRNDRRLKEIETHMEQIGENILRGDLEDIDLNTFCAWIIAKDLLDDTDAAGSNIYFYSYVLSSGRESAHQLKMGPLWDLDASFGRPPDPDRKEGWSPLHSAGFTYFPELFQNREFLDIYCSRMAEIRASLYDSCSSLLTSLCDELEGPIDASREADANRWGKSWTPVREEAEERLQWLSERSAWIGSQLVPIPKKNGELEYRRFITDVSDDCETLTIALYDDGYERVQFPTWSDENGQDDIVWYEAELDASGRWTVTVDLRRHKPGDAYTVHVYVADGGELVFADWTHIA